MFKADGTPINNPKAYAARLEKTGYTDPVFTEDGEKIRDPARWAAVHSGSKATPKSAAPQTLPGKPSSKPGLTIGSKRVGEALHALPGIMYLANGDPVKNPKAYVAKIEKNGYTKPLYAADGSEIRNPVNFLNRHKRRVGAERELAPPKKRSRTNIGAGGVAKADNSGGALMYMADGTLIKNPLKYVAKIETEGYNTPLFTPEGDEIKNPVNYVMAKERREPPGGGAGGAYTKAVGLYQADGTPIRNPAAYAATVEKKGYTKPIFTSHGEEIRDLVKYVARMEKRASAAEAEQAPKRKRNAATKGAPPDNGSSNMKMFMRDGREIKNPIRFVEGITKNGYTERVFTDKGQEIRDPVAWIVRRQRQRGGTNKSAQVPVASNSEPVLFKEDGTPIKNPSRYVAGIEARGYNEPLFNAKGDAIKDPVAYVKQMERRAVRPVAQKSGAMSYYRNSGRVGTPQKVGQRSLASKLRGALGDTLRSKKAKAKSAAKVK